MKKIIVTISVLILSACSYAPPRYSISTDNSVALKTIGVGNINVSSFTKTADFNSNCRGTGGVIGAPDNMSFESYIQKGLVEELKLAGMFDDKAPKITLSGDIDQLSFSSMRNISGGTWDIGLRVNSSNGKSIYVSEHYEFEAGFGAFAACQKIADYYMQATQNVLGKLIKSPDFKSLVTPKDQASQQNDSQPSKATTQITTTTAIQPAAVVKTNEEQLKELKRLYDAGLISKEVYLEQQKTILSKP